MITMISTIACVLVYIIIGAFVEGYRSLSEDDEYELAGVCMWPMTLVAYMMYFAGYICGAIARWWRFRV